jgi:HlyD family secretion protein
MKKPPTPLVLLLLSTPAMLVGFKMWQQSNAAHGPAGGSGVVEATDMVLSARIAARVTSVDVREGQAVKAGDRLVTLDCSDPEAQLAEARARVEAARASAAAAGATADAAAGGAVAARAAAGGGRAQAQALAAQRDAAKRLAQRVDAQRQDVAAQSLDQAQTSADALGFQASAAAASADAAGQQATVASRQADAARAAAEAAARSVEAAEAATRRAELLVAECVVLAPRDGVVETLPWEVGELAPLGSALVKLLDLTEVKATFYLPNAELSALTVGADATVIADAWPDVTFSGTVTTIATQAEFTPRNIQTRTDRDRLVYPVEVVVPNPEGKLRPGMPVQVTLPGTDR